MAYQARGPVGAGAPPPGSPAAYPHLFGARPADPLAALREEILALQGRFSALFRTLLGPATGGPIDVERLRQGRFAGCLFGSTTPGGLETAESMAAKTGRSLDVNHSYYRWDDRVPSAEDRADVAAGRTPLISFKPATKGGQVLRWADVASGRYDARLREVAQGLKSLGKPVFFSFHHEPENDQAFGTPAEYRAAWRHVAEILRQEGATNVVKTYVTMGWKPELSEAYYPGNDVVDWVAGDPYNWAYSKSHFDAPWRSFEAAAGKFYAWAKGKGKPIMIAETGCVEDPRDPGRKAQWIREMGETLKHKWPEIKAVCYFNNNHDDGRGINGWHIESPQALAAMRELAQDPYFSRH
jgi:hypothetical protein